MALVHEELYRSTDLSKIEMQDYLEKLTGKLHSIYSENRFINIDVLANSIEMDINTSIVCGLIANELVTNSLKYAFPKRKEGKITVKLAFSEQFYSFSVSDSGIGLPSGLKPESSDSLGLRLVDGLVKQLKGSLNIRNSEGASFTINFPKPREAELH
jgi:two-component sensor histidine kinase